MKIVSIMKEVIPNKDNNMYNTPPGETM